MRNVANSDVEATIASLLEPLGFTLTYLGFDATRFSRGCAAPGVNYAGSGIRLYNNVGSECSAGDH